MFKQLRSIHFMAIMCLLSSTAFAQTVTTYAGKVNSSDPWTNYNNTTADLADAYFYEPQAIAWDGNGVMYVAERNKIRVIQNGKVYNRAGKLGDGQTSHGYKNGTGVIGEMYNPTALADNGSREMFIIDSENHAVRKLSEFNNVGNGQALTTIAGDFPAGGLGGQGTPGHVDAKGSSARFDTPIGMVGDGKGNFYICDNLNFVIRKMKTDGTVTTLAGQAGTEGSTDGTSGASSTFGGPHSIAMYDANHVIVTDNWNTSIRKVNTTTGATTTLCGKFQENWHVDGSLTDARFSSPRGIVVVDGLIYVADKGCIRVIDMANKTVSTFAGSGSAQGNVNDVGDKARFGILSGLAYDGNDALYVTDIYYNLIKKVTIDDLAPDADFTATKVSLQIDEETTISDVSTGKPATARLWTIKDLSGSTANVTIVSGDLNASKDVTAKFKATGFYTVTLKVTNEYGNDTEEKNSFLNVSRTGSVERIDDFSSLLLYPNPNNGQVLNISVQEGILQQANLHIYDLQGHLVYSEEGINGFHHNIQLPSLQSGAYVLVIDHANGRGAKKFFVK